MFASRLKHLLKKTHLNTRTTTAAKALRQQHKRHMATNNALPFRITRETANKTFLSDHKFLESSPKKEAHSAVTLYKGDPVKECFIPFHSASIRKVRSTYVGEYGVDSTEYYWVTEYDGKNWNLVQKQRTVTTWHRCSGTTNDTNYPFGTHKTQIYAGFVYPAVLIEPVLKVSNVHEITPLTKKMLEFGGHRKTVHPHEMNMSRAMEKLYARVSDMERSRAHDHIKYTHRDADHTRVHNLDVDLSPDDIDLHSYHMPAYIKESNVGDLLSYKIVNGYDGSLYGNTIYSIIKSTILGAGLGGAMTLAYTLATRPYLVLPDLVFRVALGTSVSGALW